MEAVEALCESVAIVDRGRMVVGGTLREVRRSTGRQMIRISVEDDHRLAWLADVPGTRIIQVGMDRSTIELEQGIQPDVVLAAAVRAGARVTHFELADPSLEQVFVDFVGRPVDEVTHLLPADARTTVAGATGGAAEPAQTPVAAPTATNEDAA